MDRQLIERMTGGAVLIILLVVIAPALLDGRPGDAEGFVSQAQADTEMEVRTIRVGAPAERLAAAPEVDLNSAVRLSKPTAQSPPPVKDEAPVAAVKKAPVKAPPPAPKEVPAKPVQLAQAATPPKSSLVAKEPVTAESRPPIQVRLKGQEAVWAVQLGSFSSQENANKLAQAINNDGFESYVSRVVVSGTTMYRVQVGPRRTREDAEQLGKTLNQAGHSGKVVPLAPSDAN